MPIAIDHILFALLAGLFPVWAVVFGSRRLRRASSDELPRLRLATYRRAMALLWTLTLAVITLWIAHGRGWTALGLVPALTPGLIGVVVGSAVVAFFMIRDRVDTIGDDEALARVRERLRYVEVVLPHSRHELDWFFRLSVTAGICEEVLYRGYLLWYLTHWLSFWPAALVAAVLFGFGHSYQGARGILLTAAVGMFMAAVYWITGSLFAPMVLHALMDIHSGHLAYVAFERGLAAEPTSHPWWEPGAAEWSTESTGPTSWSEAIPAVDPGHEAEPPPASAPDLGETPEREAPAPHPERRDSAESQEDETSHDPPV